MNKRHKIKKISAADQVYEELRQMIIDETWTPGEKIPTETQLADEFEVNRLTVRVALQRLQALGLLDIRVGNGTFVREFDMCHNIAELSEFYSNKTVRQDVREYRLFIETECVRLAMRRRTEEDLELYRNQYLQMEENIREFCQTGDPRVADQAMIEQADMSVKIHTIICSMAHNELLNYAFAIAIAPIRQLMLHNVVRRMQTPEMASSCVRYYGELYQYILDRDEEKSLECIKRIMNIDSPRE